MRLFATIDRHAGLMNRMAGTLGVDLAGAARRSEVAPSVLREAVLSCTGCRAPDACEEWLDAHAGRADAAPDYCRNKALLARLAAL